jgi:hypothetical protein
MRLFPLFLSLLILPRAPEDGAGSGAANPDAGGGNPAPANPGAGTVDPAPGGAAPGLWADFLPDNIRGADDKETFGKLADAWKGMRDKEATRPQPPKSAAEYTLEPGEKIKDYLKDPNDPVLGFARDIALEIGLPKEHFGKLVTGIYEKAHEAGILGAQYNPQAELKSVAERIAPGKPWAEQKPLVERALKDASSFATVLGEQLKLSDGAKGLLGALTDEAAGIELMAALSGAMAPLPSFAAVGAPAGGWTKESLDAAMKDERANPYSPKFDKDFAARLEQGFKHHYGV